MIYKIGFFVLLFNVVGKKDSYRMQLIVLWTTRISVLANYKQLL